MYYPCSENKGADQLCSYREADLRLCFRICKKPVFSQRGIIIQFLLEKLLNDANYRLKQYSISFWMMIVHTLIFVFA